MLLSPSSLVAEAAAVSFSLLHGTVLLTLLLLLPLIAPHNTQEHGKQKKNFLIFLLPVCLSAPVSI